MIDKIILGLILFSIVLIPSSISVEKIEKETSFLPTENEYGEIIYSSDWEDIPTGNGKKNFISYGKGSNRNVYEDGSWKRIEKAKSLIKVYKDYINIKNDEKGNSIRVLDFNLTDAHICFKTNYTGIIPFKIYKIEEVLNEELQEYLFKRVYSTDTTLAIIAKDVEQCVWIKTNILQNKIVFGDEIYEK